MPVYRGRGREAGTGLGALVNAVLPPRRWPLPQIDNPKFRRAAHAANGQVPLNRIVMVAEQGYFAAAEGDGGVMLDVQEVGAAQMCVAVRLSRPEPPGVDLNLYRGVLWGCGIEVEPAMDVLEVPPDIGDHHVADTEFSGCVSRFEGPACQWIHLRSLILTSSSPSSIRVIEGW